MASTKREAAQTAKLAKNVREKTTCLTIGSIHWMKCHVRALQLLLEQLTGTHCRSARHSLTSKDQERRRNSRLGLGHLLCSLRSRNSCSLTNVLLLLVVIRTAGGSWPMTGSCFSADQSSSAALLPSLSIFVRVGRVNSWPLAAHHSLRIGDSGRIINRPDLIHFSLNCSIEKKIPLVRPEYLAAVNERPASGMCTQTC